MIDTHIHLTDEKFAGREQEIIKNFKSVGVSRAINIGYDLPSSIESREIANKHDGIYFACGVHPDAENTVDETCIERLSRLCKDEKCVAVGEIGLDYHYEPYSRDGQIKAFEKQIELAINENLPIIVHSRDACKDTLDIIKGNKGLLKNGGVMHCFSGSKETAKIYLDLGFYISFSGVVTFKNASNLQEIAKFVPSDMYLAETDCPYMAPVPMRGSVNEPAFVRFVYDKLAYLRGVTFETVEREITQNSLNLFKRMK